MKYMTDDKLAIYAKGGRVPDRIWDHISQLTYDRDNLRAKLDALRKDVHTTTIIHIMPFALWKALADSIKKSEEE